VPQSKRRGRKGERQSWQVFWERGTKAARRRGAPRMPKKAILLNRLTNSCTCSPLLLLGKGVEGSASPRKEQRGAQPSLTLYSKW